MVPHPQQSGQAGRWWQDKGERRLRRALQRAREAQRLCWAGAEVPQELSRAVTRAFDSSGGVWEPGLGWGGCVAHFVKQLENWLSAKRKKAITRWRRWVATFQGAVRWAKLVEPPIFAVSNDSGERFFGRHDVLAALHGWWAQLFRQDGRLTGRQRIDAYEVRYGRYVCDSAPQSPLPPITVADLRRAVQQGCGKAGGPDGWSAEELQCLPDVALERLAQFFHAVEATGVCPAGLVHWRVAFIPKDKTGVPHVGRTRPISVGPIPYRVWATVR
eukprot:9180157-Alexandrium_andersonii.AAC.1